MKESWNTGGGGLWTRPFADLYWRSSYTAEELPSPKHKTVYSDGNEGGRVIRTVPCFPIVGYIIIQQDAAAAAAVHLPLQ